MRTEIVNNFSIGEAAKLCGLPESTLRYYETIGLIAPIYRDPSTKHRVYTDADINTIVAIACLNATGLSIEDMRTYLKNRSRGIAGASEQIELLSRQQQHLCDEIHFMELRRHYVATKIEYWEAVQADNSERIKAAKTAADAAAHAMRLPRVNKEE